MKEIGEVIGAKVREVREARNMTQKELGDVLGYSAMGISHFENGIREMKVSDIQKLADFFGKSITFFLTPGLTMFRASGSHDVGVTKSLTDFEKFLSERKKKE
jgi:transcriptional regulator with XRE-family HTH domain